MAKRKGLPKKYAKMGFAKGWRAYKKSKKVKNPKRQVRTMAKRKRRVSRPINKRSNKSSRGFTIPTWAYYGVAGYFNESIDKFAASAAGRLGGVSVDIVKFVAPWGVKKFLKPKGMIKSALNAVQNIGAFELGRQVKTGGLNFGNLLNSTPKTAVNGNNNMEVY